MLDDATRARLERVFDWPEPDKPAGLWVQQRDLRALLAAYDALRAAQAQAAPVLAAAVAHVESDSYNADEMWSRLQRAVRIWRTAREG